MQSLIAIVCVRPDSHRLQFVCIGFTRVAVCVFAIAILLVPRRVSSRAITQHDPSFESSVVEPLFPSVPLCQYLNSSPVYRVVLSDAHPHGEALSLRERMILSGVGQCFDFF